MSTLRPLLYIAGGGALIKGSDPFLRKADATIVDAVELAEKKGRDISFNFGYHGAYYPSENRVSVRFTGGGCNLGVLAHELGHAEADEVCAKYAEKVPKIWEDYAARRRLFLLAPIAAGMVTSRRKKALLLAGVMPEMLGEAHASLHGARILREEGKLTRRRALVLAVPLIDRAGYILVGYGLGSNLREVVRYVRGHFRKRNGKRIWVTSHFRRIRVRR